MNTEPVGQRIPYYLVIDPGHATGWATFDRSGNGITMGTCKNRQHVYDLLQKTRPETIIMEDWVSREKTTFGGDRMETIRVIGAVEFYCHIRQIPLHEQPNTVKPVAYKYAGLEYKKGPKSASHEKDAYAHGVYYLQRAGVRRPQQGRAT